MKKMISLFVLIAMCALPLLADDKDMKETDRIQAAADVLKQILDTPDKGIPQGLLDKADCVIIYPSVKKAAFIVGGSYGRGVITCRRGATFNGSWSAPAMFALEGGSFGLQIGAQATDFVLLVMNESGAKSVLSSKVKIGADASAAAGPVGRTTSAETDVVMKAQILSWSRAQGLFAGVSLEGSTMRSDNGANKSLYGRDLTATQIVRGGAVKPPAAAAGLLALLNKATPHHAK